MRRLIVNSNLNQDQIVVKQLLSIMNMIQTLINSHQQYLNNRQPKSKLKKETFKLGEIVVQISSNKLTRLICKLRSKRGHHLLLIKNILSPKNNCLISQITQKLSVLPVKHQRNLLLVHRSNLSFNRLLILHLTK